MKKWMIGICGFIACIFLALFLIRDGYVLDAIGWHLEKPWIKKVDVPEQYSRADQNHNHIPDPIDIVNAARQEVINKTTYKNNYYAGGFPPSEEGVCTDVIWRALKGIDVDLKSKMDQHISKNISLYPRTNGKPDPNIDFRRVPNQNVYFKNHLQSLTTEVKPGNIENLQQWQPGDIVVYLEKFQHVAIISDKRTLDGVPYIIHNNPPFASEVKLTALKVPIYAHYRWNFIENR